jgi:hypothetical protein
MTGDIRRKVKLYCHFHMPHAEILRKSRGTSSDFAGFDPVFQQNGHEFIKLDDSGAPREGLKDEFPLI